MRQRATFQKGGGTMDLSPEERINLQRKTVAEHIRAENAKEWPAVHGTFVKSEDTHWDAVALSTTFRGIDGVVDFYQRIDSALPDFQIIVTGEYDTPGVSVIEATVRGTHQGEYCGIEPSGNPVSFEAAALFLFGEGDQADKLLAERCYFDNETLLRQMRGEPDAPTGIGLAERTG